MSNRTIKLIIGLGIISIIGIIVTQVYWVRRAYDFQEKRFHQSVVIALKSVAEQIAELHGSQAHPNPVQQVSSNYYVVHVNDGIDVQILEHYLEEEFDRMDFSLDYEYGVYDCNTDEMVYGNYINRTAKVLQADSLSLPKWDQYVYYFGVRFPTKHTYLAEQMDIWIFSSAVLLLVVVFFGYTLFVIFKQKQLSVVQRDFINNMTHEFKTPISTIAVSAELLANPKIQQHPEKLSNYAQIIKDQNDRLKNQINKVLQMAIMDHGKLKLNKEELDVHQLVQEVVRSFELNPEDAPRIKCQLQAQNSRVLADKVHLTNIIYNLIDNALKYVEGDPQIVLSTRDVQGKMELAVQDNGIGISPAHQKKIFQKFYRVPTGNLHNVKGFGLGLNYVRLIVKAHGWKIKLESSLGQGSTFLIRMKKIKRASPIPVLKPSRPEAIVQ